MNFEEFFRSAVHLMPVIGLACILWLAVSAVKLRTMYKLFKGSSPLSGRVLETGERLLAHGTRKRPYLICQPEGMEPLEIPCESRDLHRISVGETIPIYLLPSGGTVLYRYDKAGVWKKFRSRLISAVIVFVVLSFLIPLIGWRASR